MKNLSLPKRHFLSLWCCLILIGTSVAQKPGKPFTQAKCNPDVSNLDGTVYCAYSGQQPLPFQLTSTSYFYSGPNVSQQGGPNGQYFFDAQAPGVYTLTLCVGSTNCCSTFDVIVVEPSISAILTVPASCKTACDGFFSVGSAGNGVYSWVLTGNGQNNGFLQAAAGASVSFSGLCAGPYTLTYTDANGCTGSTSVNITFTNLPPVTMSFVGGPTICQSSTGQIIVTANGPLNATYSWEVDGVFVGTGNPFTIVGSQYGIGNHDICVSVTLPSGCPVKAPCKKFKVVEGPEITLTDSIFCAGDLSLNLQTDFNGTWLTTGGTVNGPIQFQGNFNWTYTPGPNLSGVQTLTFCPTSGPVNCCASVNVYVSNMSLTMASTDACIQFDDGTATVNVTGGISPYSYLWSNGGTTPTIANLDGGQSYTVTVTDAYGCVQTDSVFVTDVACDVPCVGCNNPANAVELVVNGDFEAGNVNIGSGGNMAFNVGCQNSTYAIVNSPIAKCTNAQWLNNIVDNTFGNGQGLFMAIDGNSNQNAIIWSQDINVVANETYFIRFFVMPQISMQNGGSGPNNDDPILDLLVDGVVIGNTGNIVNDMVPLEWNQFCFQYTAPVTATVTFSIAELPLNPLQNAVQYYNDWGLDDVSIVNCCNLQTDLGPDIFICQNQLPYTINLSSGNQSVACDWQLLNGPPNFTLANPNDCNQTFNFGQNAYNYVAQNGCLQMVLTETDSFGCTGTDTVEICVDALFDGGINVTDATCGQCDGEIEILINSANGNVGYTYDWYDAAGNYVGNTATISNLCPGDYFLDLTTPGGCVYHYHYTVGSANLNLSYTSSYDCNAASGCAGVLEFTVSGGLPPYNWMYGNTNYITNSPTLTITDICNPTTVLVTVTSEDGCTAQVLANQPGYPIVDVELPPDTTICANSLSVATMLTPTIIGSGSYTYNWTSVPSNAVNFLSATNVANPIYAVQIMNVTFTLQVTDQITGCTASASMSYTVSQPQVTVSAFGCQEDCSITYTANVTGSPGPFAYNWNLPGGGTASTQTVSGLCATGYTLSVTDLTTGCTAGAQSPSSSPLLILNAWVQDSADYVVCDFEDIDLNSNSSPNLSGHVWSSNPAGFTFTGTNPPPTVPGVTTTYTITAFRTGLGGAVCASTSSVTVTVQPNPCTPMLGAQDQGSTPHEDQLQTDISDIDDLSGFNVFPNPNDGHFTVKLNSGTGAIIITDLTGKEVYKSVENAGQFEVDLSHLHRGVYLVRLIQNESSAMKRIVIQ